MPPVDVAVVGAGPAGAWAAYRLARAGARVTVFDASHPREKPCGGGVTGRALALVADILPEVTRSCVVVTAARIEAVPDRPGAGPAAAVTLPAHGPTPETGLVVASRADFDGALLEAAVKAGARLVTERAVDVVATPAGVEVRTASGRHAADWVLGADGVTSLTRRRLRRPFRRDQLSIATGFFARGASSTSIAIACVADPPGYIWSFPRPDHLAVGICADATAGVTAGALRERVRIWLAATGIAPRAQLDAYAWPIPTLAPADLDAERPAGPGFMLLGDAAGLVDPLTREGIYFALLSGQWAADLLAVDPAAAPERYLARLRERVYPELRRAARARAGFFRPVFTRLLVAALRESPGIRAVMADLIAGRQPYRGLRRRLLGTFELGLAWRLLRLPRSRRASARIRVWSA